LFLTGRAASIRSRLETVAKAGAAAVIVTLEPGANWNRWKRLINGRPISLQSNDNGLMVTSIVSEVYAQKLAKAANVNWKTYLEVSNSEAFKIIDLGIESNWNVKTQVKKFNSYNVIAKLSGKNPSTGSVFFMGHWDHLGICRPTDAKDKICNGAVDNASGMAVLIEIAKHLGQKEFDRDIYFVGTTAEESGLLGAYSLVDNPPVDLDSIVVALNIDTIAIADKGAPVAIIGRGTTDLDPIVEKIATDLGRKIDSSEDANAFIRRQDGWAFASKGVPALMVGGAFSDLALLQKFLASDYHTVTDELTDKTELKGAAEDAVLHLKLAEHFANIATYPNKPVSTVNKAGD